ncbi:threonine aldolase family protein [Actinophytocola oryzae]|uniref:L-threonine aldolase n=1 Tax=Actinophytocola oryzae TaxID=502181 RepID=A0A4R7UXC5_9PSEU|nr:beta-eliminating lyase-related protein [Actinophytocola oryzae]TDV40682.1 L-threonine aldolase [Actinophytocola oryzae]
MGEQEIRRSLVAHAPLRRRPHTMLRRMLDRTPPDAPLFGPDAPVARLERRLADLLGKPRALFFPSGTMAQQVALRIHAERTGRQTFTAHPANHLDLWEQRGYAAVHGLRYHPAGDALRLLTLDDLHQVHEPVAALLIELPQREIGGLLPTWEDLNAQVTWARERGAATHLDGARLWEAQPFYDRPHAEIAGLFDTVYVSLYKGLEGVRGAVLAGDDDIIGQADVWRQRLGGAIPDAWPLAVAAMIGLDDVMPRMAAFRDHALEVAGALAASGLATVVPDPPQTPLFHVLLPLDGEAATRARDELLEEQGVQVFTRVRAESVPGWCGFEITISENAMEFTPEEVVSLIDELTRRAPTVAGCRCSRLKASRPTSTPTPGSRPPRRSSGT